MNNRSKIFVGLIIILVLAYPTVVIIENVWSMTQISGDAASSLESRSIIQPDFMSYTLRVGQKLYLDYCTVCHGEEGDGLGFNAYTLETKPRNFSDAEYMNALSDERLAETIREGGRGVNKSMLMPAWGITMSQLEISYVVKYVRLFAQTRSASK